jgi:hypothetical protein
VNGMTLLNLASAIASVWMPEYFLIFMPLATA